MESTTETGFFITVCDRGLKEAQGVRRPFDPSPQGLVGTLHDLTDARWWWSPHTFRAERPDEVPAAERSKRGPFPADYRREAHWESASCIAFDLDWHTRWEVSADGRKKPAKEAPTDEVRARLVAALGDLPAVLGPGAAVAHHTPNGARLVLLLTAPITDAGLYRRAFDGAKVLVQDWLSDHELLGRRGDSSAVNDGDPVELPGYEPDPAAEDLARTLWAPRAIAEDPKTGARTRRTDTAHPYGDPATRFDPDWLANFAPASLTPTKTHTAQDHAPHAFWPAIEAALSAAKGARVKAKGVTLCCPMHADATPSAIVFRSGVLKCKGGGCAANAKGVPLERWAATDGGRALLGDELVRALLGEDLARLLTAPVRGDVLKPYWHTVGEWGADSGDWLEVAPPPMDWLLTVPPTRATGERRHVLPRGVVGMLAAGGGVGKSMALVQLAVAVATEKTWLTGESEDRFPGFETHNLGGDRVLLALGEEDALKARRRLYQAVQAAQLTPDERERLRDRLVVVPLASVPVGLMADRREREEARAGAIADELERRLAEGGPWALVVLDPLSRFAGMETEGDNAAATRFIQVLERFTKAPGAPTVLVSHHTGQGARREGMHDATAARGVTGLTDGVRWVATLTREVPKKDGDEEAAPTAAAMLKMAVTKNNYAGELWPFWLSRGDGGLLRCATKREVDAFKRAPAKAAKAPKHTRDDGLGDDL